MIHDDLLENTADLSVLSAGNKTFINNNQSTNNHLGLQFSKDIRSSLA